MKRKRQKGKEVSTKCLFIIGWWWWRWRRRQFRDWWGKHEPPGQHVWEVPEEEGKNEKVILSRSHILWMLENHTHEDDILAYQKKAEKFERRYAKENKRITLHLKIKKWVLQIAWWSQPIYHGKPWGWWRRGKFP